MTENGIGRSGITWVPSPTPGLPYSPAAIHGGFILTSGVMPTDPEGRVEPDFSAQVLQALQNLGTVLTAAGADWESVLKVNGYVSDIEKLPLLNEAYIGFFHARHLPARTTVEVSRFRNGVQVEFDAVAIRGEST